MGTGDWVLRYSAFRIRTPHSINYVHRFSICEWQSAENRPLRGGILRISSRNCNSFPDPARTTVQPPPKSPSPPGEGRGEGGTSLKSVDTKRPAPRTKPLAGEGSVRGPMTVPHSEFPVLNPDSPNRRQRGPGEGRAPRRDPWSNLRMCVKTCTTREFGGDRRC